LVGLVGWDLVSSTFYYKKLYRFETVMQFSPEYPLRNTVLDELNSLPLERRSVLPARVFIPWPFIPQNDGMIYHYSNCDAYTSLFLSRPWRYVHELRQIPLPSTLNTFFSVDVYKQSLLAYPQLAVDLGYDLETQRLVVNTNLRPRAFLVFASTNVGNADRAIATLRDGWNIYDTALAEAQLNLPETSPGRARPVHVKSFNPNELVLDVNCDRTALLVLAEAWYPGWKALDSGKAIDAVVVNSWMRAFPLSPGTKQVRVCFHQNYLLLGGSITIVALVLFVLVHARKESWSVEAPAPPR